MQAAADATPSGMVSILLLDVDQVQEICREASGQGVIQIANYLCPGNLVLSGVNAACERAAELAEAAGGRAVPLAVAGAFHTEIMKPADDALAEAISDVNLKTPDLPVISNVDAKSHSEPHEVRNVLVRQVVNPVYWEASLRAMIDADCTDFYEIGPGKVLKGLLRRVSRKTQCTTINDSFQI